MLVIDRMSREIVAVRPRDSVTHAKDLMARHHFRHLPVLRGRQVIGIVSDHDLLGTHDTVADVMTLQPLTLAADASVDEAARVMLENKVSSIPIVKGKRMIGILTTSDVLEAFIELSGVTQPSTRIIVTGNKRRDAAQQIRDIVHHCHGELRWIHQQGHTIHLRLNSRQADDIVTALEGAGFDVAAVVTSGNLGKRALKRT